MKKLLVFCLLLFTVLYAAFILKASLTVNADTKVDTNWSIKELADKNDIKPGEIKKQLAYSFDIKQELYGSTRLSQLKLSEQQLRDVVSRIRDKDLPWMFILKIVIWAFGLGLIWQFLLEGKNKKRIQSIRAVILLVVLFGGGFLLGPSPNPMESLVQLGKTFAGFEGSRQYAIGFFVIFIIFSVIGPKFFCSWACPLGALQESIYNIPGLIHRRFKIPFRFSIAIRGIVFIGFLLSLFVFSNFFHGRSFFQSVNYFGIFNPAQLSKAALYTLPVFLVLSFFTFRPFCHLICPFGFVSWFIEKITLKRISLDNKAKCVDCKLCVKVCPTGAMGDKLEGKNRMIQADCWSCGKCISACPQDIVVFK